MSTSTGDACRVNPLLTFAVDGNGSCGVLTDVQEAANDDVAGRAAVHEEEVVVLEAGVGEAPGVVNLLVQTDDARHVVLPEVREVCLGGVQRVTWGAGGANAHSCQNQV